MKRYLLVIIFAVVGILILTITALPQEKQKTMQVDQKQMQIMQLMRDSSSVNMLMDRIASDSGLRTKLMEKIINRVHNDSSGMMQICKIIRDDKEFHSTMMKMMKMK